MDIRIEKSALRGSIQAVASKSDAHRALLAASLSDSPCFVQLNAVSDDIKATASALRALGANMTETDGGFQVAPIQGKVDHPILDCGESGSTLRFLLPVAAAVSNGPRFIGNGKLPERPIGALLDVLVSHGVAASSPHLPLTLSGSPEPGDYTISGGVSSQYISGLLFMLPLLHGDSILHIQGEQVSKAYTQMTVRTLRRFGVALQQTADGYTVPGGQRYTAPICYTVEGDWSNAAFFLAAGASVRGLDPDSAQPDKAITRLLSRLGSAMDVSGCPDLFPILAVQAAFYDGVTRFTGGANLRVKECDRLSAMTACLQAVGACIEERADGMTVYGGIPLHGADIDGCNDHRIVMAMSIAGAQIGGVRINGAEAVRKSYPSFFMNFQALGGEYHVL